MIRTLPFHFRLGVFTKSLANDRHSSRRIKIFLQNIGKENIRAVQGGKLLFENSFESNSGHNKKVRRATSDIFSCALMVFILKANYLSCRAQEVGLVSRVRLPRYINPHFVSNIGTMILPFVFSVSLTINIVI